MNSSTFFADVNGRIVTTDDIVTTLDELVQFMNALKTRDFASLASSPNPFEESKLPSRKDFRMPSIKPLPFSGKLGNRPAHEIQNILDDYLERNLENCRLYNLAPDVNSITHNGQPTYVQFVSSGLTDTARQRWRQLPEPTRNQMTWPEYVQWINKRFGSQLALPQAIDALDTIQQTGSAVTYSSSFNELVSATSSANVDLPEAFLCVKYLNGLKPHLQVIPELGNIRDDLSKLQAEAERLDDVYYRRNMRSKTPVSPRNRFKLQAQQVPPASYPPGPFQNDSMDLDALQQGRPSRLLTPAQKAEYRSKGWCVYCQSKDHSIDKCIKLKNKVTFEERP
ncbi:hypothetical protein HDU81_000978 [Chytriomyces hyalinus]|nr:hypothetical protein HDU81_000978 [Chytriomyces hyalinus]